MLVEVKGLGQTYGRSQVLKNINLEVQQREVFVVIGPTGCGKTTLLRLISLLDKPASGSIYFKGEAVGKSEKARREIRRRMAFVFQKPAVFNTTVFNNVAYGLKVRNEKGSALGDRVASALDTVGLSGFEKRKARTLSGGEIQRVALARAMVVEPELLLLDEPTANLDPQTTSQVEDLLAQVIQKLDTTVIMSTHDLYQGQRLADRMGIIMAGELLQTGPPRDLFNLPRGRKIAEFVGVENILDGEITSNEGGIVAVRINGSTIEAISNLNPREQVHTCIRPEEITLAPAKEQTSARNTFSARITGISPQGPFARVELDCGFPLIAVITIRSAEDMGLRIGTHVYASFKATGVHIIRRK